MRKTQKPKPVEVKTLDLTKFNFPALTEVDLVFPTMDTNKELLAEAKLRGFYGGYTPYNDLFTALFFRGGRIVFKKGIDPEFKAKAWAYCRAFMGGYVPKHEEKEAICAMLMSELLEPNLAKKEK